MCYSNCPYELWGLGEKAGSPRCTKDDQKQPDAHCYEGEEEDEAQRD